MELILAAAATRRWAGVARVDCDHGDIFLYDDTLVGRYEITGDAVGNLTYRLHDEHGEPLVDLTFYA